MKILKIAGLFTIVVFLIPLLLIGYASISDYRPAPETVVQQKEAADALSPGKEYRVMTWNVGYAGLGAEADFFYEGGTMVRSPHEAVKSNLEYIGSYLLNRDSVDFVMLQEVDRKSKRSYKVDQTEFLQNALSGFHRSFARNYDVFFVPVPPSSPMGSVESGLLSFSRPEPSMVTRHSFPGNYSWPKNLFMLDRCFMVQRFPLENGHELLMINTHNSAYDDGTLRAGQMAHLASFLESERAKGNYIVVGGDWNQLPPDLKREFPGHNTEGYEYPPVPKDYLPGWQWAHDPKIPTNRFVGEVYTKGTTSVTILDFFLVSPNIEVKSVSADDLDFQYSDHQPVILTFTLK